MSATGVAPIDGHGSAFGAGGLQLLSELQSAHNTLLACIAVMEGVTAPPVPDSLQLTRARLKISQASLTRRLLWRRIQEFLLCRVRHRDTTILRDLSERDLQHFRRSTAHVSKWTADAAVADWPGYQAASKDMRAHILANIRAEQTSLYPMLYRYR